MGRLYPLQFCADCLEETSEEEFAGVGRLNGCGTCLINSPFSPACPNCGSQVARVWFTFLYLPLIPLCKFRVFYGKEGVFTSELIARRVTNPRGRRTVAPKQHDSDRKAEEGDSR
jgi:hypothetical protein